MTKFQFPNSNSQTRPLSLAGETPEGKGLFVVWILVIGTYLELGLPAAGRDLVIGFSGVIGFSKNGINKVERSLHKGQNGRRRIPP